VFQLIMMTKCKHWRDEQYDEQMMSKKCLWSRGI